jgi:hypothetical protein
VLALALPVNGKLVATVAEATPGTSRSRSASRVTKMARSGGA